MPAEMQRNRFARMFERSGLTNAVTTELAAQAIQVQERLIANVGRQEARQQLATTRIFITPTTAPASPRIDSPISNYVDDFVNIE
jgi:hypothetical protein